MRRLLVTAALTAALAAGAQSAALGAEATATHGGVTATLTWDEHELPDADANIRLRVLKRGAVVSDGVVVAADDALLSVIPTTGEPPAIAVRDLDADGRQEVLVSLFTGGAHCCWETQVYKAPGYKAPPDGFRFGQNPFRLRDLGRGAAADLTLGAATEDFVPVAHAATGRALVVLNYRNGRFVDVSRRFKKRLKREARTLKRQWRAHKRGDTGAQGVLAAYVADLERLGRHDEAEDAIALAGTRHQLSEGTIAFHKDIAKLMKALRNGRSSPFARPFAP